MLRWAKRLAVLGVCAMGLWLAGPVLPASAQPSYGPTPAACALGTLGAVVSTQAVGPGGGTVSAVVNGGTVTVTVPAGVFPGGSDVVFSTGVNSSAGLAGFPNHELFFAVSIDVDGVCQAGPFSSPILVSVASAAISANASVFIWNGTEYVPAPGGQWTVSPGHASGSFSSDPAWMIAGPATATPGVATPSATTPSAQVPAALPAAEAVPSAAAPSAVPGATSAVTGKPLVGEGAAAGALVLAGLGAWRLRRRVRATGWRR